MGQQHKLSWRDTFIISLIAVVIIILLQDCSGDGINIKEVHTHETDTIYVDKPYQVIDTLETELPPRFITIYQTDTMWKEVSISCLEDSLKLVLDSLAEEIMIHKAFLSQFPVNPKLVELNLTRDSLGLTLLDTDGNITSTIYPTFLDDYRYQWYDDSFRTQEKANKPKNSLLSINDLYGKVGYQFLRKNPLVSLEYQVRMKQYKFSLEATSTLETEPKLYLIGQVGYKITK